MDTEVSWYQVAGDLEYPAKQCGVCFLSGGELFRFFKFCFSWSKGGFELSSIAL